MSIEFKDEKKILTLLGFYKDYLQNCAKSQRTRANLQLPEDPKNLAQILSYVIYNPEVALVWGADLAYSQLEIWAPLLKRSASRHVIFCKSLKGKPQTHTKLSNVPAYGLKEGFDAKAFAASAAALKSMLYMTDKNDNFAYIRACPDIVHIAAHHGDSDKHSSYNRICSAYDFMMVADNNSMMRYLSAGVQLSLDKFLTIGNSLIEGVTFAEETKKITNILYAPTFEGYGEAVNFSSVNRIKEAVKSVDREKFKIMLRAHPGLGKREPSYKEHLLYMAPFHAEAFRNAKAQQFNWSDAIICDISGILSEYIFTGKPIIVPVSENDGWLYTYIKKTGIEKYVYLWDNQKIELEDFLTQISDDPLKVNRHLRRRQLFGGLENLEDATKTYDRALNYASDTHYWRSVKDSGVILNNATAFSFPIPEDPELIEIIKKVQKGELIFKLD